MKSFSLTFFFFFYVFYAFRYLASVGFENRSGNQKVEYSSNWRRRLQQVKLLKSRILEAKGEKPQEKLKTLDVEEAEQSRSFTQFT